MDQSLVQAWLQAHGLFTLAPARLQRVSERLAKEGITNEDLDLLWQHAVDTGAARPAALLVGSLDGNWKLALKSIKAIDPALTKTNRQYPGDFQFHGKGKVKTPLRQRSPATLTDHEKRLLISEVANEFGPGKCNIGTTGLERLAQYVGLSTEKTQTILDELGLSLNKKQRAPKSSLPAAAKPKKRPPSDEPAVHGEEA